LDASWTLDQERETLGVLRGPSVDEIRNAFRRRAREVHPDQHPSESESRRRQLAREFDRAREARDILVKFTSDPARVAAPAAGGTTTRSRGTTHASPTTAAGGIRPQTATAPSPPRERSRPRTSESRPRTEPPRVTIRLEGFVRESDASSFGPGRRMRRWIDCPRFVAWSSVGVLASLVMGGSYVAAYAL